MMLTTGNYSIITTKYLNTFSSSFLIEGMLQKAAEAKKDEDVLIQIRDKDSVSLEVRYHASCYKNYTRFFTRKNRQTEE